MTVPVRSALTPLRFGIAALALTLAGWLWFVVCFSAPYKAWWNSLGVFFGLYLVAILLALRGIRSWAGITALIVAGLSLACVALFLFG